MLSPASCLAVYWVDLGSCTHVVYPLTTCLSQTPFQTATRPPPPSLPLLYSLSLPISLSSSLSLLLVYPVYTVLFLAHNATICTKCGSKTFCKLHGHTRGKMLLCVHEHCRRKKPVAPNNILWTRVLLSLAAQTAWCSGGSENSVETKAEALYL